MNPRLLQKTATETSRRGEKIRRESETEWWEGVYPPVEAKRAGKEMKIQGICGVLLYDDGNHGRQAC